MCTRAIGTKLYSIRVVRIEHFTFRAHFICFLSWWTDVAWLFFFFFEYCAWAMNNVMNLCWKIELNSRKSGYCCTASMYYAIITGTICSNVCLLDFFHCSFEWPLQFAALNFSVQKWFVFFLLHENSTLYSVPNGNGYFIYYIVA